MQKQNNCTCLAVQKKRTTTLIRVNLAVHVIKVVVDWASNSGIL